MLRLNQLDLAKAIENRNKYWKDHPLVPDQHRIEGAGLDRFFTRKEVARACYDEMIDAMVNDYGNPDDYTFVEPSAGNGVFLDLLPDDRRIGIDIMPENMEIIEADFLSWDPPMTRKPYAVIGNPPFGNKGWMALPFMQKAASFADYIGFILPMNFSSSSIHSIRNKVVGAELVNEKVLPFKIFEPIDDNRAINIFTVWQFWKRGVNNYRYVDCKSSYIDYSLINTNETNKKIYNEDKDYFQFMMPYSKTSQEKKIEQCHLFIQASFYLSKPVPKATESWDDINYGQGHGIIINKSPDKVKSAFFEADWMHYSNLAGNNKRTICKHHIYQVLIDAGLTDKGE